jgi:hypothetical protein
MRTFPANRWEVENENDPAEFKPPRGHKAFVDDRDSGRGGHRDMDDLWLFWCSGIGGISGILRNCLHHILAVQDSGDTGGATVRPVDEGYAASATASACSDLGIDCILPGLFLMPSLSVPCLELRNGRVIDCVTQRNLAQRLACGHARLPSPDV